MNQVNNDKERKGAYIAKVNTGVLNVYVIIGVYVQRSLE